MCTTGELIETELDGDHASGATTLTVAGKDGTTNMASADILGIQTDSGGIQWTTINGTPTSTTIVPTAALSGAAGDNNNVYTYTTVFAENLLRLNNLWRRTDSGIDIPLDLIPRQEYVDLSDKDSNGVVTQGYYDPRLDTGVLSLWQTPGDSQTEELIYLRGARTFQDFDAGANTPDFPQEWYLALTWGLAKLRATASGVTGQDLKDIIVIAEDEMRKAVDFDTEDGSIYIMPDDQQGTYRR